MKKYAYKGKALKLFKGEIPEGWTEITLEDWYELKKTFPKPESPSKEEREKHLRIAQLKRWFAETDYIELQASRGTISRDSEKYTNYLNEYNEKLGELRELES